MDATEIPKAITDNFAAADPVAHRIDAVAEAIPPAAQDVLSGKWLGHPLHPVLTDLPIGFWTSSMLLDLFGKRVARTSTAMAGLGVATAIPTVASGLAEWRQLPDEKKRVGVVHVVANLLATALFALSVVARLRGMRGRGVAFGMLGGTVATVGGLMGGHLAFGTEKQSEEVAPESEAEPLFRLAV